MEKAVLTTEKRRAVKLAARWLPYGLVAILYVFCVAQAWRGVDFGRHWDEFHIVESVTETMETGLFMKRWYDYPSLSFGLALLSIAPETSRFFFAAPEHPRAKAAFKILYKNALLELSESPEFHLRVRRVFAAVALFSIFWIFGWMLAWQGNAWTALLAAAIFGLSWEINYHARWIAPDAVMMQFGALTLFLIALSQKASRGRTFLLRLAAVAAGLACGTKYPGGALLLPVALAVYEAYQVEGRRRWVKEIGIAGVIFFITYVYTTPGTILDPVRFISHVSATMQHYGSGGHAGYDVLPLSEHLPRLAAYLSFTAFSHYGLIALFYFILSLAGLAVLIKQDPRKTAVFLAFPLFFFLYISSQRVMIVRNVLVLFPFLAIFAAAGIYALLRHFRKDRIVHSGVMLIVLLCLAINAQWLVHAARSINRPPNDFSEEAVDYVQTHPELFFLASPRAYALLEQKQAAGANVVRDPAFPADYAILFMKEVEDEKRWPANRYGFIHRTFGPLDVNFDYYPTWVGKDRILVLPAPNARPLGVFDKQKESVSAA